MKNRVFGVLYHFNVFHLLIIIVGLLVLQNFAFAQGMYSYNYDDNSHKTGIRFLHADKAINYLNEENYDVTLYSGTYDLYTCFSIGRNVSTIFSYSFAINKVKSGHSSVGKEKYSSGFEISSGNLYIGLQNIPGIQKKLVIYYSGGINIPMAEIDDPMLYYAAATDIYESEKFWPRIVTIGGSIKIVRKLHNSLRLNIIMEPNVGIPVKKKYGTEIMPFCRYGGLLNYKINKFNFICEYLGKISKYDLDDIKKYDLDNYIVLGGGISFYNINPTLFYQYPFDEDIRDITGCIFGFRIDCTM